MIEITRSTDHADEILMPEALEFVAGLERHCGQVMRYEREPLGRSQRFEDDQESKTPRSRP